MASTSLSDVMGLRMPACAVVDPAAVERYRERIERQHAETVGRSLVARSGIPEHYRDARLDGAAVEVVSRFERGDGCYIHGDQGRGKTTAACAAAMELLRRGRTVRYLTADDVLADADLARREPTWDRSESYARPDLLVLDDVDKLLAAKDYGVRQLFLVADVRQGKPTVYTSNVGYRQLAGMLESVAGASVAGPVMSRIQGACGPAVKLTGDDRRVARWSARDTTSASA